MKAQNDQTSLQEKVTMSHLFGEMVWLFTQSTRHQKLPIEELTWQLMPALMRKQFHFFLDGIRPVGVAIWAQLDETGERQLIEGQFHPPHATEASWDAGDRLWLVDLVAPFATAENHQLEVMLGDLVTGIFRERSFNMLYVDPVTREKQVVPVSADTAEKLASYVAGALS